ncbi:P-loop ATPase, Sll1717 family [Terriglobus albidus]|uniref:P-loop ATPase, Sll1717 family n=1 Tax=Terriglobus albidus TaxID=1592106 RepID=UPI0021E0F452|nr:hypothetical protein [Terriglobus albidus]
MAKESTSDQHLRISRQAFAKAKVGQSFAEHDLIRANPKLFVETPAIRAALDQSAGKSFFVGRRGTGKTAITYYLRNKFEKNALLLIPKLLSSADAFVSKDWDRRVRQKPFNTLVSSFVRAIVDETVFSWKKQGHFTFRAADGSDITRERPLIEQYEFDLRLLTLVEEGFDYLGKDNNKEWLRFRNRPAKLLQEVAAEYDSRPRLQQYILIDRLDDEWDDSDSAVILVMALMHACVEIRSATEAIRPMVFLRENVFDRVRELDSEFSRLETSIVTLDWTKELLRELVEKRLNEGLISKFALDGSTWKSFFAGDVNESQNRVFGYCQYRPRDILLYVSTALSLAQSHQRSQIEPDDLQEAQRSFSENRLKELSDEYADNYPSLSMVLGRFYGLGTEYTIGSIEDFIKKLLVDSEVQTACKTWIYNYTQPDLFVQLLYNIGFVGLRQPGSPTRYKASEADNPGSIALRSDSGIVIHPSYVDGLSLQKTVITSLSESVALKTSGLIYDVPESFSVITYRAKLQELTEELQTLPRGRDSARQFENLMGEMIKLCFFRSLSNVQPRVRNGDNTGIRDWIASNRAAVGFWAIVREKYAATQILWECKNYDDLHSDDFHQANYYIGNQAGRFLIMLTRAQSPFNTHTYDHVRRVFEKSKGLVLLLRESDIKTFLRQALNGKHSEQHLQDLFDNTERMIS